MLSLCTQVLFGMTQSMEITSEAFKNKEKIPVEYTCQGQNISPPLQWVNAPEKTESYVLIMDDPDAPGGTWVHWVVYNISKETKDFQKGSVSNGCKEGITSFGKTGYGGPCPPSGTHRYYFKIYALDIDALSFKNPPNKEEVLQAIEGHILAEAEIMGTYVKL